MSRTQSQTVPYFGHDTTQGRTSFVIQEQFGNDGYVVKFKLLELLGATEGHFLDLRELGVWEYMVSYFKVEPVRVKAILDLLARLQWIDGPLWSQGVIWAQTFVDRLEPVYKKRTVPLPTKPVMEDFEAGTLELFAGPFAIEHHTPTGVPSRIFSPEIPLTPDSGGENPTSKVKQSKEHQTKPETDVPDPKGSRTPESKKQDYLDQAKLEKQKLLDDPDSLLEAYPMVIHQTELAQALLWLGEHYPSQIKKRFGQFYHRWLKKAQDKAERTGSRPGAGGFVPQYPSGMSPDDIEKHLRR